MTTNINIGPYDFRARLRFPGVAREPNQHASGVSHQLLFPPESCFVLQSTAGKNDIKMIINKNTEFICLILGK